MTKEEIINQVSMPEVAQRYNIKISRGMCSCPFHGRDKHPSMKVYPTGYHCFACGSHGDIFSFVMQMEGCDFKSAFLMLGGSYEEQTDRQRKVNELKWARIKRRNSNKEDAAKDLNAEIAHALTYCREAINVLEPLSDDWCFFQNQLPKLINVWETRFMNSEEVNVPDVYRLCRSVVGRFNPL